MNNFFKFVEITKQQKESGFNRAKEDDGLKLSNIPDDSDKLDDVRWVGCRC